MHHSLSNMDDLIIDEPIDDSYIIRLHQKLQNVKQQRKRCEKEAALVNGRVNCLKNEQAKTLKKIELTKKKTHEKVMSIERQQNKMRDKVLLQQQKEREIEALKRENYQKKKKIITNIKIRKNEQIQNNREEAKMMRELQKQNEEMVNYIKIEEINNKKSVADYIKSQHYLNEERKRAAEIAKKNAIKIDLENKIETELKLKAENDEQIEILSQTEIEILNKINDIRTMHKQLIDDFQKLFIGDISDNNNSNTSYLNHSLNKVPSGSLSVKSTSKKKLYLNPLLFFNYLFNYFILVSNKR